MTGAPSPEEMRRDGDDGWAQLWPALNDRSDEELLRPGAAGDWTGKDALLHLARWHEHGVERIRAHLEGREPVSRNDYEAWNARWYEEDRDVPVVEARRRCEASRAAIRELLGSLAPERWDDLVRGAVDGVTGPHYEEHLDFLAEESWPD